MRIIQKGELPPPSLYHGTCTSCKCTVEVEEKECKFTNHADPFIKCPTDGCPYEIFLTLGRFVNMDERMRNLFKPDPAIERELSNQYSCNK